MDRKRNQQEIELFLGEEFLKRLGVAFSGLRNCPSTTNRDVEFELQHGGEALYVGMEMTEYYGDEGKNGSTSRMLEDRLSLIHARVSERHFGSYPHLRHLGVRVSFSSVPEKVEVDGLADE